jgi:hypothetical protein
LHAIARTAEVVLLFGKARAVRAGRSAGPSSGWPEAFEQGPDGLKRAIENAGVGQRNLQILAPRLGIAVHEAQSGAPSVL